MFPKPLVNVSDLDALTTVKAALSELQHVFDAITLTRENLKGRVPLIGFTGAPVCFTRIFCLTLEMSGNYKQWRGYTQS